MTAGTVELILASASPRRRELIALLGIPFRVVASRYEEPPTPEVPVSLPDLVFDLATRKALEVADRLGLEWVLAADTLVSLDDEFGVPLGKPVDEADASRMLSRLSGRVHTVFTGIALVPARADGEQVGLIMLGLDYAYLTLSRRGSQWQLAQATCPDTDQGSLEISTVPVTINAPASGIVYLRVQMVAGARCRFSYSLNGEQFERVGNDFQAREGKWVGARMGLFCSRSGFSNDAGGADVDWWHVTP